MEIKVSDNASNSEWNAFVSRTEGSHYTQSGLWAQVKEIQGWRTYQVYAIDHGVVTAGAQILARPLRFLGWAGCIPHGLLGADHDLELQEQLILALQEVCRLNHIQILAFPYWSSKDGEYLNLDRFGFKPCLLGNIDPPATNYADIALEPEDIIRRMDVHKRNQVRCSQKRGLCFREGTREEIETFYRLHLHDCERIGYCPEGIDYFYRLWDVLEPIGLLKLFFMDGEEGPVNSLIVILHRDHAYSYKIGWSGEEHLKYPNEAIHWSAMMWAKEHGYCVYDFDGLPLWALEIIQKGKPYPERFIHSYTCFKYRMGGNLIIFPPLYDYIPNPIFEWGYRNVYSHINETATCKGFLQIIRNSHAPTVSA